MPFVMQDQLPNTYWCWAAVASSVDALFAPRSFRAQCAVARLVHGHRKCCNVPTPEECDQPDSLTTALQKVGRHKSTVSRALPFSDVQDELDNDRVVCVRVVWRDSSGGAHFVVISGYGLGASGDPWLLIDDPLYGPAYMPYIQFRDAYRSGQGFWSDSYFVQR